MLRRSFKKLSKSILWRFFPQIKAYSIPYRASFFWGAAQPGAARMGGPSGEGFGGRLLRPSGPPGRAFGPAGSRLRLLKSRPPNPSPARPKAFGFRPGAAPPPPKNLLYSGSSFIIFSKNVMPSLIYNPEALASFSLYAERE